MRALYEVRFSDPGSGAARLNGNLGEKASLRVPCVGKSKGMLLWKLAGRSGSLSPLRSELETHRYSADGAFELALGVPMRQKKLCRDYHGHDRMQL